MVIVVPVMFRFACSLLCYVVLYSVIMLYLLVLPFICLCWLVVHVDVGDGHASRYALFSGYELLWIWWIVMWYPHDDVDIMFMYYCWHHVILSWLSIFAFKLTGLNWTWTTVGWVMVPPYRADQCNHAYRYGMVLTGSIAVPLAGASNEGRLWARATLIS